MDLSGKIWVLDFDQGVDFRIRNCAPNPFYCLHPKLITRSPISDLFFLIFLVFF